MKKASALPAHIGYRPHQAQFLGNLGMLYVKRGETSKGLTFLQEAYAIDLEQGDSVSLVTSLINIGDVARKAKDFVTVSGRSRERRCWLLISS